MLPLSLCRSSDHPLGMQEQRERDGVGNPDGDAALVVSARQDDGAQRRNLSA